MGTCDETKYVLAAQLSCLIENFCYDFKYLEAYEFEHSQTVQRCIDSVQSIEFCALKLREGLK